jgi:hypothetical protein
MCPPVTAFRTDLPGSLDAWFARALARDRHARFSSATEMCEAFKHPLHRRTPITHEIEIEEHDLVAAGVPRRHLARWALAFAAVAGIVMGVTHTRELGKRIAQARAGAARDESAEGAIMPVERQVTPIRLPHGYTPSVPPTRSISTTARTVVAVVRHHATHDAKIATMASPDPSAAKPLVKEDPSDLPDFGGRE